MPAPQQKEGKTAHKLRKGKEHPLKHKSIDRIEKSSTNSSKQAARKCPQFGT